MLRVARTSVALWSTGCSPGGITIGRMTTTGAVTNYAVHNISSPVDITAGPDGAMWFTASGNVIGRITTSVTPTTSRFTPPQVRPEQRSPSPASTWPGNQGQLRRHRRFHRVRHCHPGCHQGAHRTYRPRQ